jgi:hypothetical protein
MTQLNFVKSLIGAIKGLIENKFKVWILIKDQMEEFQNQGSMCNSRAYSKIKIDQIFANIGPLYTTKTKDYAIKDMRVKGF